MADRAWSRLPKWARPRGGRPVSERDVSAAACDHERVSRVSPLYVDGRPLYKCDDCGARFVYDDDKPSFKGLAKVRRG